MQFKVITNIKDFKNLENDWNLLFLKEKKYSIFQSFKFNYSSWEEDLGKLKNILSIVVIYIGCDIKAIFPFYIDKQLKLRFINDVHSDFCDYLSSIDIDIDEIINKLKLQFPIKHIQLINLRSDTNTLINLKSDFNYNSFAEYSVLELEKGFFPDNILNYKSKQKTEFRRILKINKEKTHHMINANNSDFPISEINFLREKMISLGLRDKRFLCLSQLKIIEKLFKDNKIILSIVKTSDRIHAISFLMKDSRQYLIWIDMYDDSKMVNLYNYISVITSLSSESSVIINFGRGGYNYKLRNFLPEVLELYSINIFTSKWQEYKFNIEERVFKILKYLYNKIIK